MKTSKLTSLILCGALALSFAGCAGKTAETSATTEPETSATTEAKPDNTGDKFVGQYPAFKVTSKSLHNGYWDDVTSNTGEKKNASPELTWEPVEGASCYVIYMVDVSANCFLHWVQGDITETSLPEGSAKKTDYIGPYPPSGAHQYNIYVIALKNPVKRVKGGINTPFPEVPEFIKGMETDKDGNTGNVLAAGKITGLFKSK